jgi:N4-gp56 family major capsid protein
MASQINTVAADNGALVQLDNAVLEVWSKDILYQAQPQMRFEAVAQKQTELGVLPGNKISFLKFNSLGGSSALTEGTDMETDVMSTSTISITVSEQGKAIAVSEMLLRSSFLNVMDRAATLLGMHYAKNRDSLCRDTLLAGTNLKYSQAGGAAASRADLVATSTFNVKLVRDAAEFLATNKAPKFNGDAYICFVHPHQGRCLREDNAWIDVRVYAQPDQIYAGEIGRVEDVRFIETTQVPLVKKATQDIWADGADTGTNTAVAANAATDVYRAVVVGDYSYGIAESLPVEMRDNGVEDFGRKHSLAYYGIWGMGLIETGHSLILETA